MIYFVSHSCYI